MSGRRVVLTPFEANQRWECGSSAVLSTSAKTCQLSPAAFRNVSRSPRSTPSCRHLYRCKRHLTPIEDVRVRRKFPAFAFQFVGRVPPPASLVGRVWKYSQCDFHTPAPRPFFHSADTCPHCVSRLALSANLNHSPCTASFCASSVVASCIVSLAACLAFCLFPASHCCTLSGSSNCLASASTASSSGLL